MENNALVNRRDNLAIVGSHPSARGVVVPDDCDIWVFNEAAGTGMVERVDGVFQIHQTAIWKNPRNRNDPKHYEWLTAEHPYPIWMQERDDEIPSSEAYPLSQIVAKLLPRFTKAEAVVRYFTSSVAYALALGIYFQYSRIELYGVEMETNTEYGYQRDGVYFWIGVAVGAGIIVKLHEKSGLFEAPLYGYEGDVELHLAEFETRLEELKSIAPRVTDALAKCREQQTASIEIMVKAHDENLYQQAKKGLSDAIREQSKLIIEWGALAGAVDQNQKYIERGKAMDEATGKHIFVRQEFEHNAAISQQIAEPKKAIMQNYGGQATTAWKRFEASTNGNKEVLLKEYQEAHEKFLKAGFDHGLYLGTYRENVRYIAKLDTLIRAAGGSKAVEAIIG